MDKIDKWIFERHAALCQTMASPLRLEIISLLSDKEIAAGELAKLADVSQANMSQHLMILRERGIVETRRHGTNIYYKLADPKMLKAFDILREILMKQFQGDQVIIDRLKLPADQQKK